MQCQETERALCYRGFVAIACQNMENWFAFVKKLVMEKQSIFRETLIE